MSARALQQYSDFHQDRLYLLLFLRRQPLYRNQLKAIKAGGCRCFLGGIAELARREDPRNEA